MRRKQTYRRVLATLFAALLTLAPQPGVRAAAQGASDGAESLRFELPSGGEVRVENRLGGVRVETWGEQFLEMAVASDGPVPAGKASPVRVERTERLLSITVAGHARPAAAPRGARTAAARVDLTLRVPAETRLTIFTSDGAVEVRGRTARLDAQTVSGDLRVELPAPPDADVMARTLRGRIVVRGGAAGAHDDRVLRERFQARLGAGRRIVRLTSVGGRIELAAPGELAAPRNAPAGNVLPNSAFRVFEDNVEQPLTHFESAAAPFDLLLLVDLSGSTAKVADVIRAACLRFVEAVRARDRVGVVAFAGTHAVVSPLTDDKRLLRTRLETMGAPAGDTKLYDAVNFALEHLAAQSPKGRRRAVVLLSDGLDSVLPNVQGDGSALAYDELRRRVQEFDGLLYTVWTDNSYDALSPLDVQPETFDLVYDRMEELAALGGGVFHEVAKLEDLAGVYARVVEDLGTVYSLTFQPANKTRDGRWRAVRVRLPRRPDAVARGRSGYFAK
ncbi:MAG: VWA domain-containing protein [Acidobacteria bacterium]|nr:VWA domain-containing protein [Acidobacteriota bacterium]